MKDVLLKEVAEKRDRAKKTYDEANSAYEKIVSDGEIDIEVSIYNWGGPDTVVKKTIKLTDENIEEALKEALDQDSKEAARDKDDPSQPEDVTLKVWLAPDGASVRFYGDDEDEGSEQFAKILDSVFDRRENKKEDNDGDNG